MSFYAKSPATTGIPAYSTVSSFPSAASAGNGALAIALDTDTLYISDGSSWKAIGSTSSVMALGNFGSSPNAQGASISSNTLTLQPADGSNPGGVSTTTQTLVGAKTFSTSVTSPIMKLAGSTSGLLTLTVPAAVTSYSVTWPAAQGSSNTFLKNDGSGGLSWASGTGASGVDSIGTIDSQSKTADALVISGTTLYAQTADATHPGMVSTGTQTIAGAKTFSGSISASNLSGTNTGDQTITLTGDVTGSGTGSFAATIANSAVTNAKMANMVNNTVKGNKSGSTGAPSDLALSDVAEATSSVLTITNGSKAIIGASNLTIAVTQSTTSTSGYLSNTDWNTFNGKQASGNYLTALTGDATASGPGSAALTLATVNANVGSFGSSTAIPSFTVNAKGLVTAASTNVVIAPAGTLTGTTLAANVVTSSLTTIGTVTSGTWNATAVDATHGGTGLATYTLGDLLYSSASNTLSKLAGNTTSTMQALTQTGTGSVSAAPVWTSAVSTNTNSTIVVRDGSGNFSAGTITAALTGNASTATKPASGSAHGAAVLDSSGNFTSVAPSTSGNVLTSNGTDWISSASSVGKIVQVKFGTYATATARTATSFADTSLTVSITPTSVSNKILVFAYIPSQVTSASNIQNYWGEYAIFRDGSGSGVNIGGYRMGAVVTSGTSLLEYANVTIVAYETAPDTSAHSYTVAHLVGSSSATITSFIANKSGYIVAAEVAP